MVTAMSNLSKNVAEEVRALLGRRRVSQAELATGLDRSPMYLSRRLSGELPLDLDEVEQISAFLGVSVDDLLMPAAHAKAS